jgi:long-subunit fatty acid transport protein
MRANWHYVDAPGTAGVTYGYQTQEDQIIAVRPSLGAARTFGPKWSAGATLGIAYNQNDLHAPYIFQQQPQLAGLKVLLNLTTRGYGWNGSAGVQWQPSSDLRMGLAWKSGTTIHTQGEATGSASALFNALGITASPLYSYHAQVMNHLPQAFDAGIRWRMDRHLTWVFEGDFTAWGQAFQQLPVTLTGGTNATINSVVGSNAFNDSVPLHWSNQGTFHGGIEAPVGESWTLRGGYSYATNPVPNATLTPLTAAIMQNGIAGGAGWTHNHWQYDAAYLAQLPSTQSVGQSGLLAGEYSNSRVMVWIQSVTLTARVKF